MRPKIPSTENLPTQFQSTHPHGVRPKDLPHTEQDFMISIHAPAWGATILGGSLQYGLQFQSTHPHGVRLFVRRTRLALYADFNPRTRMGCDGPARRLKDGALIFQSTHPHGVRQELCESNRKVMDISIHAPAWGATTYDAPKVDNAGISIHAPAWGATEMLDKRSTT